MPYVGQTRSRKLVARLAALGIGEMTQPKEYPPRRRPWVLDNAAFKAWKAGETFAEEPFRVALEAARKDPPVFIVVPDAVAAGLDSLALSLSWVAECEAISPAYLAVQDGMDVQTVENVIHHFGGLFVGGTLGWKIKTGEAWVKLAHKHGKPCHIGRVGTPKRVRWARRIGADSIDSCLPLWSEDQLRRFLYALGPASQTELFLREFA